MKYDLYQSVVMNFIDVVEFMNIVTIHRNLQQNRLNKYGVRNLTNNKRHQ